MDYEMLEKKHIAPTYNQLPITVERGEGVKLIDVEGNEYLDFVAGLAVKGLGHAHPEVAKTLEEQSKKIIHTSNLYHIREQIELARELADVSPGDIQKFFFCNSGTEAVEAALKLSIKHTDRDNFVAMKKSFHGRTSGSLGVTWKDSYKDQFKDLVFSKGKFCSKNLEEVKETVNSETAAFIAEPIQGEGGVEVMDKEFLHGVKDICEDNGALMIMDEVQSGMCRTGKWFATEHSGIEPDIITIAKALGNGVPIGTMGARPEVMDSFSPGDHASTFGGNPLCCSVGKTVIEVMKDRNMPEEVEDKGEYFKDRLGELVEEFDFLKKVRGRGLMLGILTKDGDKADKVVEEARKEGFLINCTSKKILRFIPPLVIERKHIDRLVGELKEIMRGLD
mgnify:CR=1 FL=1